ncbi:MAG: hypothetical protein RL701_6069 [Pseudomonadota bacterium]|jgi:pimeloyl-ACP methyl ester carboxylesterase
MPFVQTPDAKLHYTVFGPDDPQPGHKTVLLIMGLGGHASEWGEGFLSRLRQRYQLVCMDNRGIAESESRVDTWTLQDMAEDALAVLDAISCTRACVAGTSMGGMVAQLLALTAPERVERLALMATSFGGRDSVPPGPEINGLFLPPKGASAREIQRQALRALTAQGFAEANAELVEQFSAQRERIGTKGRVFQAQFNALLTSDRSQVVRKLTAKTLVLHGDSDLLIPPANGRLLAERIPGSQLIVLEHCGHLPHLEKPVETSQALSDFFG